MRVRVAVLHATGAASPADVSAATVLGGDGASFWAHRINFTVYARYGADAADLAGSSLDGAELCPENGDGRGARWFVTLRCDARRASPWAHTIRVGDQTLQLQFEPEPQARS